MKSLKKLFCGLVLLAVLCCPLYAEGDLITISISEFQTLKTALKTADEQLTLSAQEIQELKSTLNGQDRELETLKRQLNEALGSLKKSENAITFNGVKIIIVGACCLMIGGAIGYLIRGAK